MHEKSAIRHDLASWRGRDFTPEEMKGFELDNIVGKRCRLFIEHQTKDGTTYANVTKVVKAEKGDTLEPSGEYVRVQDRPTDEPASSETDGGDQPFPMDDDDDQIPF